MEFLFKLIAAIVLFVWFANLVIASSEAKEKDNVGTCIIGWCIWTPCTAALLGIPVF